MSDAKKFLFDTHDFSGIVAQPQEALYTEEQIALAREQGRAEALQVAKDEQEARIAALLHKMVGITERVVADEERREVEKCIDAVKLAMRVIHKILPQLSKTSALSEIENVILQSVEARKEEPRLAVTVPTAHLEALKARVDEGVLAKGYGGKIILVADDALSHTDCRVEWADGGMERLYERLVAQVETEFTKAISGMESTINLNNNGRTKE